MLVSALYNIVDQLFIGQGVGTNGNAATNIAFPFSTACMAIALLLGIGGASCFNLTLGRGDKKLAGFYAGNAITMLISCGVVLSAITLVFLTPLLKFFGSPDEGSPMHRSTSELRRLASRSSYSLLAEVTSSARTAVPR